jgi:uncharacterized protein YutE (UPF0331/DUF86 family)
MNPAPLTRRLLALQDSLAELARPQAAVAAELVADRVLRAAVERWLQIAVEACVDVAYARIAAEGWTPPETARSAFVVLASHGVLAPELALRLGRAVGMRNILVHDYVDVDVERLAAIVRDDLGDLRTFASVAADWGRP